MTWQSPLNKLFVPFRRNKVYASWKLYKTSISVNRGSHFQVRFVWQVWDGQLSPSFKYIRFWVIIDRPTPATQNGLENVIRGWPKWMFVKLSRSINFVPPEGYKKLIEWGLPSHLLIFAPASAWSLLHITCLSPSSLSALLHMCRDALVGQKLRLLSFPQWTWLVSSSAHPFPVES